MTLTESSRRKTQSTSVGKRFNRQVRQLMAVLMLLLDARQTCDIVSLQWTSAVQYR